MKKILLSDEILLPNFSIDTILDDLFPEQKRGEYLPITAATLFEWAKENKELTSLTTWIFDPPRKLDPGFKLYSFFSHFLVPEAALIHLKEKTKRVTKVDSADLKEERSQSIMDCKIIF